MNIFTGWTFRPTLWPTLGFIALFAILLSLGNWQLGRADEKQALIAAKQARQTAPPLILHQTRPESILDRFRLAIAEGQYEPGKQWLLDNRLYQGRPGYHVYSLFRLRDGTHILLNRGWISQGASRQTLPELPLPVGQHQIRGRLDTPASVGLVLAEPDWTDAAAEQVVPNLDIAALAAGQGLTLPALALMVDPDQPGALQHDWQAIETLKPEKHQGYAVQWFALALALLIIYIGVNLQRQDTKRTSI
ncbi:MAG: SURF1 family protein [Pseudomonadota bacterium]